MEVLTPIVQADFSGGMFRWPRHLIPPNGMYDASDVILTDDGSLTQRGGTLWVGDADTTKPIISIWSGYFPLVNTQATIYLWNQSGSAVAGNISFGGAFASLITTGAAETIPQVQPYRTPMVGGVAFITPDIAFAGNLVSVGVVGTVTVTNGSTTVVGAGTTFTSINPNGPGQIFTTSGSAFDWGVVKSITDNTHLELKGPWRGPTGAGLTPTFSKYKNFTNLWPNPDASGTVMYSAAVGSPPRLVLLRGQNLVISEPGEPWYYLPGGTGTLTAYHTFPDGGWGAGVEGVGDTALCFMTHGVWAVDNLNLDQTDPLGNPQHRIRRVSDLALWGNAGIVPYKSSVVVAPMIDDIYLFDGRSTPQNISKPITSIYRTHVEGGNRPGGAAIWRNHYILPIYDPSTLTIIETLVCRLDTGAWTRWSTRGLCYAGSYDLSSAAVSLIGGERTRLSYAHTCFTPGATYKNDAIGDPPELAIVTRDEQLGSNNPHNLVKQVRVTYELADAASDDPTLRCGIATDAPNSSFTSLANPLVHAPESDGGSPFTWTAAKGGRVARLQISSGGEPNAGLTIRRVEMFVRPSGKRV